MLRVPWPDCVACRLPLQGSEEAELTPEELAHLSERQASCAAASASFSPPASQTGGRGRVGLASFASNSYRPSSSTPPPLRLDDETLRSVSRAIMGRLDVVDLVGKKTAYEVAERVSRRLTDLRCFACPVKYRDCSRIFVAIACLS